MILLPKHLSLYRKIAWLFLKHARPAIVEQTTFGSEAISEDDDDLGDDPEDFARRLEKMGPTFVKLGQLLSTRGDLLPKRYTIALERLQDDVEPLEFETIRSTVEEDLGVRLSKAFEWFDPKPLASASLGQVHEARLRDGKRVVVKIQRPNVEERITDDLDALENIARYADEHTELGRRYRFSGIIEQFRRSLMDELDYGLEARNLRSMRAALKEFPNIVIPDPVDGLCSRKTLTMDFVEGVKVTDLSGVSKTEVDGKALSNEIFRAYLRQVLILGMYHSDPHPGNILITPERKVAMIDLGMVGRVSEGMRDSLFALMMAISDNDSDKVAEVALRMSSVGDVELDRGAFVADLTELVGRSADAEVCQLKFGSLVMDVMKICSDYRLQIPREISMLGKTLLNLDRIAMTLDPDFNPSLCIRENLSDIARERSMNSLKRGSLMSGVLEMKELVTKSPQRINDLLTVLSENRLRIDVDAVDETKLIRGFQKIANRIALGAVIGSMIVGASLMMDVESGFTLWGYPGFPMILFMVSGLLGAFFVYSIAKNDE